VSHHRGRDGHQIVEPIVSKVAEREGTEPSELEPLYEAIDPDALATLFRDTRGRLRFTYVGYEVVVTHGGEVRVSAEKSDPPARESDGR
jgi:hypothetical protein